MDPTSFTPVASTVGGLMIGLATGLALLLNGKIVGISGVVGRILRPTPGDAGWRGWFLAGMVAGGAITFAAYAPAAAFSPAGSLGTMVVAGLLVGLGARLGGG